MAIQNSCLDKFGKLRRGWSLMKGSIRFVSAMITSGWDAVRTVRRMKLTGDASPMIRALWLQRTCIRMCQVFGLEVQVSGRVPTRGILVSNHLGYLDIVAIGSVCPTLFLSKAEVRNWPLIGWFARMGGTLFVRRESRMDVGRIQKEMDSVVKTGGLLTLFPEGTSSDGSEVLPFRSALLESAMSGGPLTAAGLSYEVDRGSVAKDVAYHGGMTLLPHLAGMLSLGRIRARLAFRKVRVGDASRKQLAHELREEVVRLRKTASEPARKGTPLPPAFNRGNLRADGERVSTLRAGGSGFLNRALVFSGPRLEVADGHTQNSG